MGSTEFVSTVSEPIHSWREEDGIVYFSVVSDGTTGPEWIKRLEGGGFYISKYSKMVLNSNSFKPTSGMTTEIAVLKDILLEDSDRTVKKIRGEADNRKLAKPNAEIACLIREMFTDDDLKAMDLIRIVTMHEPITDSIGNPYLLYISRYGVGSCLFAYYDDESSLGWSRATGFALVVSANRQLRFKSL